MPKPITTAIEEAAVHAALACGLDRRTRPAEMTAEMTRHRFLQVVYDEAAHYTDRAGFLSAVEVKMIGLLAAVPAEVSSIGIHVDSGWRGTQVSLDWIEAGGGQPTEEAVLPEPSPVGRDRHDRSTELRKPSPPTPMRGARCPEELDLIRADATIPDETLFRQARIRRWLAEQDEIEREWWAGVGIELDHGERP